MRRLKKNKRGAWDLESVPGVFLILVLIVTFGFAGYLVLAGLQTAVSDGNATNNLAVESAITNMTSTLNNVVTYAPTWGTIIGVAVLIGIVVAAFAFSRRTGEGAL